MTIRSFSDLKQDARQALQSCSSQKQIAFVYTAVLVGLSLLLTVGDYVLTEMISGAGGLSNLGTRSTLSALQTMLPIAQMLILLGWNAGFFTAMLKIIRREYADASTLRSGFSLFFPMLRALLLEGMIYFSLTMLSFYLSFQIYMFTPWAQNLVEILEPMLPSILSSTTPVFDDATLTAAMGAMVPMLLIFGALYFLLSVPVSYRLRMSTYCLIDAPGAGAMNAMRTSRRIMRGNCFRLFRLDLSFWWYHGLVALASIVQMVPMFYVSPWGFDVTYYVCYGLYLAILFSVYVTLRNRVETAYAAAYEDLREKPQETAVVLGNIFDM